MNGLSLETRLRWGPSAGPRQKLITAGIVLALLVGFSTLSSAGSAAVVARFLLGAAAIAVGVAWTLRRSGPKAKFEMPPKLRLVQRLALSPKVSMVLVEAEGDAFVVVFGDGFAELKRQSPRTSRHSPAGAVLVDALEKDTSP